VYSPDDLPAKLTRPLPTHHSQHGPTGWWAVQNGAVMSGRSLAGAGAVGLTAVFALAPLAHAAPAKPTPSGSKSAPAATGTKSTARVAPADETTSPAPTPVYGYQKFRVGVQVKAGADVPSGTTTAGSQVHVVETNVETGEVVDEFTCTTQDTLREGTTTFCPTVSTDTRAARALAKMAKAHPNVVKQPSPSGADPAEEFLAAPGVRVTMTQVAPANKHLRPDTGTGTVDRCEVAVNAAPVCLGDGESLQSTDVIFEDPGLPPIAVDDVSKTQPSQPVTIKVIGNDSLQGAKAITDVVVEKNAQHGKVKVVGNTSAGETFAKAPTIVYTPADGFSGTDHFTYTLSTANGSDTARVTVTVPAPAPSSSGSSGAAPDNNLANTGTDSSSLVGLGSVLLLAGGGALVIGRRRRADARHARIG
jgi:LPXTG-motif cell wall-anchored protein